jgi:hypothetical protein
MTIPIQHWTSLPNASEPVLITILPSGAVQFHAPLTQSQALVSQPVVGFYYDPTTVLKDIKKGWNNFVETGQIWALGIGVVVGYLLKSITSSH